MFKGGMAGMMKKAQQMQDNMQKAQEEIKLLSATGKAAGGAVEISINGEHLATHIKIDDAVMDDKDMLEDLILTAMNDATKQISDMSATKMKGVTGGMSLPGGMNLPF
ncbi:YbaB/EbfC family nucleoid-associated protein [Candidatus Thioglobus sp.]|jgi:DNA-binding YbaB/EbfC family protein|uniref:YbaB/EbfC family nucleoid-associated protein n=1 Tax=Candidatus Thioglobus sp. TaxID=2026721 RepID=UPI0017579B44|nr:YbaB/EbfC family nucleoid-associated protein [Candidatus Thioglobus sp.]HIL04319.1 YbaB/EbfC family nucleoid-associated protein [Candidatus Thioglobus autotrophicus]HIB28065.1 YbaB/EbfC family nucleoid-associated protein [Candidatus Thioglobus sp.]HIB31228.1 YbaB/EbfC family nucleoid-associated protein [Candidatus Thioglobus sp.]HIB97756.1 YbaB/EbfC family nucleoid-associated protein [Candidatus Thioglobus sp.]HIF46822.1 YbaB/EbfC family nucleoid-associated protein [Candidatus Thioglobus sp